VPPLFNGTIAAIVNPCDGSGMTNPTISISFTDSIDLTITSQIFCGIKGFEYGKKGLCFMGDCDGAFCSIH